MLNTVKIWIWLSTLLVASGWILPAIGELNRAGYTVAFALAAGMLCLWLWKSKWRPPAYFRLDFASFHPHSLPVNIPIDSSLLSPVL